MCHQCVRAILSPTEWPQKVKPPKVTISFGEFGKNPQELKKPPKKRSIIQTAPLELYFFVNVLFSEC